MQYQNQLRVYQSLLTGRAGLRVLDVGCAQATLALLLAEGGHDVTAVDLRKPFLDYAATRYEFGTIRFLAGNVLEMARPGEFDVVFCNQVVEHLVYPERLVVRLADWLAPEGLLVVTTPNGLYARNSLPPFSSLGDRSQHEHRQFTADGDGHFFAFRPEELLNLFPTDRFDSLELTFFETPWMSGHMMFRFVQPCLGRRICALLERATLAFPRLRAPAAHQLMVVARVRGPG